MPTRTLLRWLPNASSVVIIALMAANYFTTFGDLDYTWHIRTGEIIVRTGDIQPPEHFTYTLAGWELPDFEWLYEAVLWLVWDEFGYGGLKLLRVLLVSATLLLLVWRLRVAGIRWHGVAFALTIAVAVLAPAWNLRPLFCSTLGLLALSGWLHDQCTPHAPREDRRRGKRKDRHAERDEYAGKPLTWWLPVLMLVWANCHPAVIMGQALLLGAIGWEWLNHRLMINTPLDAPSLKRLTLVGGLAVLATAFGADPIARLRYPFRPELAHPIQRVFVEMQPLYATITTPPYTSGLAYLVAIAVGISIILRFRQYRGWEIMLLAGLTILANAAVRSTQDWLLVMLAVGMPHCVALFKQAALADRQRAVVAFALRCDSAWKRLWLSPLLRFQWAWPATAATLLVTVSAIPPISRQMPVQDAKEWPSGAITYLQDHKIHGHFFAPPDYGAYLTWRLGDDARCYTDTRGFFMPPVLLEDCHYVPQLGPDWRARLDRILNHYSTDYFVLETTGPRGELWRRLQPVVGDEVLYVDQQSVVLRADSVRRGVREMDLAARR